MYKGKSYRVRPKEEIFSIIEAGYEAYPQTERIFLADGDALAMDTELLVETLDRLYARYPKLERVTAYGGPKDILEKTPEELKTLKSHGLEKIYLGVESGSGTVLKMVHKGVTPEEMMEAGQKVVHSGMKLSWDWEEKNIRRSMQ